MPGSFTYQPVINSASTFYARDYFLNQVELLEELLQICELELLSSSTRVVAARMCEELLEELERLYVAAGEREPQG